MNRYLVCCLAIGTAHAIAFLALVNKAMALSRAGTPIPSWHASGLQVLGFPVSQVPPTFFQWASLQFGQAVMLYGYIAINATLWGLVGGILLGSAFSTGQSGDQGAASQDSD
jgi:hypothetical protein